jgi:hypothetical protein
LNANLPRPSADGYGFIDEDETLRLDIELIIEPTLALAQDVGAILLGRVASLFLRLIPWPTKKRCRPARDTTKPTSASASRNSSRGMSLRASHIAMMSRRRSSTRRERMSPPNA